MLLALTVLLAREWLNFPIVGTNICEPCDHPIQSEPDVIAVPAGPSWCFNARKFK